MRLRSLIRLAGQEPMLTVGSSERQSSCGLTGTISASVSTSATKVAIVRFKRLAPKGGKAAIDAMGNILVSVATDAAKRGIGGLNLASPAPVHHD